MASDGGQDLNQQKPEADRSNHPEQTARKLFSWWYVWIPVIVAVTLWIGGWWFGNYGGPWGSRPQFVQPKISDQAVAMQNFSDATTITGRAFHQRNAVV
jgi:heme A synthase